MATYVTRWFDRWAKKQGLEYRSLATAVRDMKDGRYDADLGGGLVKKRIARTGEGKSGGFRVLVATNKGDVWFFVFGFAKNARSNIDKDEEEALKKLATSLLALSPASLAKAQHANELKEVEDNA
jgi:hypothetical protein